MIRKALLACLLGLALAGILFSQTTQTPEASKLSQNRKQSVVLLQESMAQAAQIRDVRNRAYAMTQIGTAYRRFGEEENARAAFREAYLFWQGVGIPGNQKTGIGMLFADDFETGMKVVADLPRVEDRDRMLEQMLKRPGYKWGQDNTGQALGAISYLALRESILVNLLLASKCEPIALQGIPAQLTLPHTRAVALAVVASCQPRESALAGRYDAALALAKDSSPAAASAGPGYVPTCGGPRYESARDQALQSIGQLQADAGDLPGALITANAISGEETRADLIIYILTALAKNGRTKEALAMLEQVPQGLCRASAYEDLAPALWKAGEQGTAREIVKRIDSPTHRAYALMRMARIELNAKHFPEANSLLAEAAEAAIQSPETGFFAVLDASGLLCFHDRPGALVIITRLDLAVESARIREPNQWETRVVSLAEGYARAGNVARAMELIQGVRPGNRAPAFRRIASAQVQLGGLTEAVVWVRALRDPFERCFALMGAAQGLWYAKEEAAVEQN